MMTRTRYVPGTIAVLLGFILIASSVAAQELAWYHTLPYDKETQISEGLSSMLGVENGVVLAGVVQERGELREKYVRRVAEDGTELWRLAIPLSERESLQTVQLNLYRLTSDDSGGWWIIARYADKRTSPYEQFFVRHRISGDGRLLTTTQVSGPFGYLTEDGVSVLRTVEDDRYTWRLEDIDAGTVDTVSFNLGRVLAGMRGEPRVAWNELHGYHEFFLLSDGILGECVLVSVDLRSGRAQMVRLDDVPTAGLSGLVTRDGSVVILGRETRWREGELHDLVLIRPGIEGRGNERVRLPLSSAHTPTLYGTLSNGDLIYASNQATDNRIYRISPDGSSISYLQLFTISNWSLVITPDDGLYVHWEWRRFGKVSGKGITSSLSEDHPPTGPWVDLDLSLVE